MTLELILEHQRWCLISVLRSDTRLPEYFSNFLNDAPQSLHGISVIYRRAST
jgi:hypothetical protein